MRTCQQFRDLPHDPRRTFHKLFCKALKSLLPDLADAPWYVREREVVNLFVFRHLVPQFQAEGLDIGQLGIEVPVQVSPESVEGRPNVSGDIVVWPHIKAGVWRTCKPLSRIEWKNISCREGSASSLRRQHEDDVRRLHANCELASLNYAVLTARKRQTASHPANLELLCTRIVDAKRAKVVTVGLPCDGTGDESTIFGISYDDAMRRPTGCKVCLGCGIQEGGDA
jgi:hypothetical protein